MARWSQKSGVRLFSKIRYTMATHGTWRKTGSALLTWQHLLCNYLMNILVQILSVCDLIWLQNGLYSALPFLGLWINMNISPVIADKLISSEKLSIVNTRRLMQSIGRWPLDHRYRISLNKRAGRGGRKQTPTLVWLQWKWQAQPLNTLALSGEILIEIGFVVVEIWPVKVKSRGRVYSSRHIYIAKYGMSFQWNKSHWILQYLFSGYGRSYICGMLFCVENYTSGEHIWKVTEHYLLWLMAFL